MGRLRYIKGSEEAIAASPYVIHAPAEQYFERNDKLFIEVGMGKGRFMMEMAALHPEVDFIGIERYESVLLRALQKYERLAASGEKPENLRFMCIDALEVGDYFKQGSVDRIYLNFSDPWPKDRHSHRRLVCDRFLKLFRQILKKEGTLEFKTDNEGLFDFALTQVEVSGFEIVAQTRDLHNDEVLSAGNVMTEYEEKFSARGNKIHKLILAPAGEAQKGVDL